MLPARAAAGCRFPGIVAGGGQRRPKFASGLSVHVSIPTFAEITAGAWTAPHSI